MIIKFAYRLSFLLFILFIFNACTDDELSESVDSDNMETTDETDSEPETGGEEGSTPETPSEETTCTDVSNFVFSEKDGLVLVEFEKAEFSEDWKVKSDGESHSGDGYMVWQGSQSLGNPGNGAATYKLKIENAGTYQFMWHSAVTIGNNGTEHNDTWLRFNDASDFFAQKNEGTRKVYPKGTGKTPNPEGATKDGWFKIYRSGSNVDFKWQASTYDNNAHDVFVAFDSPGTYLMEISARSSGHGIDKFVLFNSTVSKADAIASETFSVISCD